MKPYPGENGQPSILTFSRQPWDRSVWKNRHQLITRLAKYYRIVYVEEPFYAMHVLKGRYTAVARAGRLESVNGNVMRYRPPKYLPLNYRYPGLERLCQRLRVAHLRSVCGRNGITHPILLMWDPEFSYFLRRFDESLACYFADDQYGLFGGANPLTVAMREERLIREVDVVFATSQALCDDKKRFNPHVHLVPNAVDFESFGAAARDEDHLPADLQAIERPILGFVGSLDDKVDYELLTQVATQHREWSVVIIGADNIYRQEYRTQFKQLINRANVKWLGFRDISQIPAYLKGMDVCTIPNRVNEFTQFVYPIKLHEYLAAGKPIISTDMPSVRPFDHIIHIAHSAEQWTALLQQALSETGPSWVERRQRIAKQHTWERRAEDMRTILTNALENYRVGRSPVSGVVSKDAM